MSLPTSGSANGVSGYYIIPEIGAYRAQVGWNTIEEALLPPDSSVANVEKRPSEHQYLNAWSNADYQRLKLDSRIEHIKPPEIETVQTQGLLGNINR